MKFGDAVKSFHWSKWSLRILLQLLIVKAITIHFTIPFINTVAKLFAIQSQKKRPYQFSIDKTIKPFLPTYGH